VRNSLSITLIECYKCFNKTIKENKNKNKNEKNMHFKPNYSLEILVKDASRPVAISFIKFTDYEKKNEIEL
jgi:hypothetical protein